MSKKVDLNASRNEAKDFKKIRKNHSFSYNKFSNNTDTGNGEGDNSEKSGVLKDAISAVKQKVAEKALVAEGVPEPIARVASEHVDEYSAIGGLKISPQLKRALPLFLVLLGFIFVIIIVIFILLFSGESGKGYGSSYYASLARSCRKVTVINTDCDDNNENCKHTYDEEIDFDNYIAGVVAGLSDGAGNKDFYKALAIVARSYYFNNANNSCKVNGNGSFMKYKDIDVASDSSMITDAVNDTKSIVMTDDEGDLIDVGYSMACVVNYDSNRYYLRYGYEEDKYQNISSNFDSRDQIYKGKLNALYSTVDKTDSDYKNRLCPSGNTSNGLSLIGALYLAINDNYNYQKILKYYFGDFKETKVEEIFQGNQVDGFINPVNPFPYCTSSFGCRLHPTQHTYRSHGGIDIAVGEGTTVYAVKSGIISTVRDNITGTMRGSGSYGNYILINHGDGTMSLYAHLKYGGIMVSLNENVVQGQPIALSGNTGDSTGPHLHYEVYLNGTKVDPYNYLDTSVISNPNSCNYGESVPASYCR